jgi:DNA repair exonuclease SbcCD ATPase subunit
MKNILAILSLVMCFAYANNATAQMTKKEAKEWKKRIKALSPEMYKSLLEENKSFKGQVSKLKKEVGSVDSRIKDKDDQIAQYQDQVSGLRKDLASAKKATPKPTSDGSGTKVAQVSTKGVVFKVQIGAFKKKDLSEFSQNNPAFQTDSKDDLMKYSVGTFRDYWQADTFKKYLREVGVKDAFIVSFKDGKNVPIKSVLEGKI